MKNLKSFKKNLNKYGMNFFNLTITFLVCFDFLIIFLLPPLEEPFEITKNMIYGISIFFGFVFIFSVYKHFELRKKLSKQYMED